MDLHAARRTARLDAQPIVQHPEGWVPASGQRHFCTEHLCQSCRYDGNQCSPSHPTQELDHSGVNSMQLVSAEALCSREGALPATEGPCCYGKCPSRGSGSTAGTLSLAGLTQSAQPDASAQSAPQLVRAAEEALWLLSLRACASGSVPYAKACCTDFTHVFNLRGREATIQTAVLLA